MTEVQPPSGDAANQETRLPRSTTPMGVLLLAMVLVIVPLIVLCQVIAVYRWDVVDDQMFAYYGWRIANGATVYLDVWDNKPPGIYWINALGMLVAGGSYIGVVAMCVLAMIVAHAAFFVICLTNFHRDTAAFATILFSFFIMHVYFTGGTDRTETFLVALELAGVAFYMRGLVRDRWWKFLSAGLLCGSAFLFKQVGLVAWGAIGLHTLLLVFFGDIARRDGLRRCVLLTVGAFAPIAAAALLLAAQGALSAGLFATFGFNRSYFNVGDSQFPYNFVSWYLLSNHFLPHLRLPMLMAIGGAIHAFLWWIRPQDRPADVLARIEQRGGMAQPRTMFLYIVWYCVALYGAMLSPHAFRHYLVPTIPPLLLMGTYLVNVICAEMQLLQRLRERAWTVAAFVIMGYFVADAVREQWRGMCQVWVFRYVQEQRADWEVLADEVRRVSGPEDKLQCWGYYPGVYLHARRENAVRFTTTEKVGQVGDNASFVLEELETELKANPPAVIVISHEDYLWMHGLLTNRPPPAVQLGPWIDALYTRVSFPELAMPAYVYKRSDLVQPGDARGPLPPPVDAGVVDRPSSLKTKVGGSAPGAGM